MKNDLEKSEFKDFTICRSKSQQEIDTQIGRSDDEFRKNESSEEIHELGREEYRDAEESAEMSERERSKPCKYGSATNYKRSRSKKKKKKATHAV